MPLTCQPARQTIHFALVKPAADGSKVDARHINRLSNHSSLVGGAGSSSDPWSAFYHSRLALSHRWGSGDQGNRFLLVAKCLFNNNCAVLWPFYTVLYAQYSAPDSPSKTGSYFLTGAKRLYSPTVHSVVILRSVATKNLFFPELCSLHLVLQRDFSD